jgi:hypothetical protein
VFLAWLARGWLRVARMAEHELVAEVWVTEDIGAFPALAVDDAGVETLAASRRPNIVGVFGIDGDHLVVRGEILVGAEMA